MTRLALRFSFGLLLVLLFCGGCTSAKKQYYWGEYEDHLYESYKHPDKGPQFHQTLLRVIEKSDEESARVPPGICAEYAYGLYLSGKTDEAVRFFEREMAEWPESTVLMVRLIDNIRGRESAGEEREGRSDDAANEVDDRNEDNGTLEDQANP